MKGNQGLEALAALCGGATKAKTKEEGMIQVPNPPSNPIMPPPPAVGVGPSIASNKGIPSTPTSVLAPSPPNAAGMAPYNASGASLPAASAPAFPMVADFSSPQFQQALLAASIPGAPMPSPAVAAGPAAGIPGPAPTAANSAVSALLSAGLPPGFLDQTSAAVQQLAAYHFVQAQAQAQAAQAQAQAAQQAAVATQAQQISQPPAPTAAQVIQVAPQQQAAALPAQPPASAPPPVNLYSSSAVDPKNVMAHIMPQKTSNVPVPVPAPAPQPLHNSPVIAPVQAPKEVGGHPSSPESGAGQIDNDSPTQSQSREEEEVASQPLGPAGPLAALGSVSVEDKKQLKRAANRRSAQLSRKRKKQFIEELKEENDELRRKEQILRSIPDLIVVFDSAGRLWFVSHSVSRFLDYTPQELESESFWDRLCDESVRLLKAAFMDALAASSQGCDTVALGSGGLWELRLVDRDGSHKLVTLNGVVHFSGDAPECVCSIRPRDDTSLNCQRITQIRQPLPPATQKQPSKASLSYKFQPKHLVRNAIKPQQSVISNASSDDASVKIARGRAPAGQLLNGVPPPAAQAAAALRRPTGDAQRVHRAAQISDGDSSVVSESGSDP